MKIAAINYSHNGSLCYQVDGKVIFYIEEERLSRTKEDAFPYLCLQELKKHTLELDYFAICGLGNDELKYTGSIFSRLIEKIGIECKEVVDLGMRHHLLHASCGFYNSGFDEAVCIIVDGAGADNHPNKQGSEKETIFRFRFPCDFDVVTKTYQTEPHSVGMVFEQVSLFLGFGPRDAGKVMGLSTYGVPDDNFPPIYCKNSSGQWDYNPEFSFDLPYLKQDDFQIRANLAYSVQTTTQKRVSQLIKMAVDQTGCRNVVLSGGYALNCVNNYEYIQEFPDIDLYAEPISHDGGTAIGAVKLLHHRNTKDLTKRPLKSLYMGL
jgi:carbamoyltransferase